MITQSLLIELFNYDPETGWLTNRIDRNSRARAGRRSGTLNERGYRQLWIGGTKFYEHRVIWCYMTGEWPEEVDHRDGVRDNNKWENLREATRSENCQNADYYTGSTHLKGVSWDSERSMYRAHISAEGVSVYLGRFVSAEEARQAYQKAADRFHGKFAYQNRPSKEESA